MPEDPPVRHESNGIELPQPTAAPIIVSAGVVMLGSGIALNLVMSAVGALILIVGLGMWISELLPGRGHAHVERAGPGQQPTKIEPAPGTVEVLPSGLRLRLPQKLHPISAGIKGGLLGGVLMPIPALTWSILTGHGIWYPINLLAGMVWAGIDKMPATDFEQFYLSFFVVGCVIHGVMSIVLGVVYGVVLPTLPQVPGGQLVWGGVLMPLLWTGIAYGLMGIVNPLLNNVVNWPWFIVSQFVFGVTAAIVVIRTEKIPVPPKGAGSDTQMFMR